MPNTMDSIQSDNKGPQAMTLVIDRSLTIVWADPAAVDYFGSHIVPAMKYFVAWTSPASDAWSGNASMTDSPMCVNPSPGCRTAVSGY